MSDQAMRRIDLPQPDMDVRAQMTTETAPRGQFTAGRTHRQKYTSWIEQTCRDDPGARAALRSGVRRGINDVPRMHRLVAAWIPLGAPETEQRAYYTIAAVIAAQPRSRYTPTAEPDDAQTGVPAQREEAADPAAVSPVSRYGASLGAAFAEAVTEGPGREREMRESTAERRLNLLTRQSVGGLHRHLPAAVGYLRELDVPVDWAQLLDDLVAWPVQSGRISRRWLQDYYRLRAKAERDRVDADDANEIENADVLA